MKTPIKPTSKSTDNPLFLCISKIDQIINDQEWTTNNALLFSDEIASKPCNHKRLLYVVIFNNLADKISMCASIKVS
jgi:hypothetical protein